MTAEPAGTDDRSLSAVLVIPPEPADLGAAIRTAVLGGADWQQAFGPGLGVGEALWEHWGPVLGPAGLDRQAFDSHVRAYRRELWFWVLGDRLWEQAVGGLAGRLIRRLPGT